jgi:hypothetical protein
VNEAEEKVQPLPNQNKAIPYTILEKSNSSGDPKKTAKIIESSRGKESTKRGSVNMSA